jgi:hypothetical protein
MFASGLAGARDNKDLSKLTVTNSIDIPHPWHMR